MQDEKLVGQFARIADAPEELVRAAKEKENLPPTPPIREKETNDNNNSRAREKAKRFKKPTVKEVADYIREMRYSFDAAQFVAYYTAVGWKVGRNPMKDWKAACSTWQRRQQSEGKPGRSAAGNPQRRRADNWVGSTEEQRKGLEDAFRV